MIQEYVKELEVVPSSISCGIHEIVGVCEATECTLAYTLYTDSFTKDYVYLFSDTTKGNGSKFASLIKKYRLGTITPMWKGARLNPNSRNNIRAWCWIYNGRQLPARVRRKYTGKDGVWDESRFPITSISSWF